MRITVTLRLVVALALLLSATALADEHAKLQHTRPKRTLGFFLNAFASAFTTRPPTTKASPPPSMMGMMMASQRTAAKPPPPPPPSTPNVPNPSTTFNFLGVAFPFPPFFAMQGTISPTTTTAAPRPAAATTQPPAINNKSAFGPSNQLPIPPDPTSPAAPSTSDPQATMPPPPPPPSPADPTMPPPPANAMNNADDADNGSFDSGSFSVDDSSLAASPENINNNAPSQPRNDGDGGGDNNDADRNDFAPNGNSDGAAAGAFENANDVESDADRAAFFNNGPASFRKFWQNAHFADGPANIAFAGGFTGGGPTANRFQYNLVENHGEHGGAGGPFYNPPQHLYQQAPSPAVALPLFRRPDAVVANHAYHHAGGAANNGAGGAHSSVKMHDNNYQLFTFHDDGGSAIGRQSQTQFYGKRNAVY